MGRNVYALTFIIFRMYIILYIIMSKWMMNVTSWSYEGNKKFFHCFWFRNVFGFRRAHTSDENNELILCAAIVRFLSFSSLA